jgi:methionyl-tRNA formyltransferase
MVADNREKATGQDSSSLRIMFVGTRGAFSMTSLHALLGAGVQVCGIVVPAAPAAPIARLAPERSPSLIPLVAPYLAQDIVHVAWEHGIPAFAVGRLADPATPAALAALRPDVACVACFPRRIPAPLLALPPLGFLNLHPSLLPAYRGPAPLFWAFRNGERTAGVTVHFMDEQFDTGDVVLQAPVELPDGISGAEADRMCASLGGRLLVEAVQGLQQGMLARRRQPDGGSYYSWPSAGDFILDLAWTARRAFNFMRGTAGWGRRYPVEVSGARLELATALAYAEAGTLGAAYEQSGRDVRIQFASGVLHALL